MQFDLPRPDEYALIYDAWAKSFRKSPWAGCVPNHMWGDVSRADISGILDRGARVVMAVTPVEGSTGRRVMGYSVSEPGKKVLHWLFVKRDFRGLGVGQALLKVTTSDWPEGGWRYTHRTRASSGFLGQRFTHDDVPARVKG